MKEDMYTYHYYKRRAIIKYNHCTDYVFSIVTVSFLVIAFTLVSKMVKG